MQCTLISGTILVTDRPNCRFLHRLHVSHRTMSSIDLLDILYETEMYPVFLNKQTIQTIFPKLLYKHYVSMSFWQFSVIKGLTLIAH